MPLELVGRPLLDESLGYVECVIQDIHEAGDHLW